MAEFLRNDIQTVQAGQAVALDTQIGCNRGFVYHRPQSGIIILRGIVRNACSGFARYQVTFNGNIAIPEDGTAGPITIGLALDGEVIPTSQAIVTPTAVNAYFNVTSTAIIDIPRGCCFNLSVENASTVPINVQNSNLVVNRIA